ncbi:hypothetical protein SAMN05216259_10144 [Actinacidiphila guanduensis]|uniref:Uncharacterized protein n=1 Tax=Actinacidiphila guanduensis TaxID=310781 RepID=A0A1G9UYC5_9ACTN|nr:hypothetical protein SAMN05216259_10144 [Actinacidiphila guanduensis]
MSDRTRFLALLPALPGTAALTTHGAPCVLAALVLCSLLAVLPALANITARWRADKPRRDREQIGNQALSRIGQTDPERVVELLARLSPPASPFEPEPSPAEGPAPPATAAAPGDPAAGGAGGRR